MKSKKVSQAPNGAQTQAPNSNQKGSFASRFFGRHKHVQPAELSVGKGDPRLKSELLKGVSDAAVFKKTKLELKRDELGQLVLTNRSKQPIRIYRPYPEPVSYILQKQDHLVLADGDFFFPQPSGPSQEPGLFYGVHDQNVALLVRTGEGWHEVPAPNPKVPKQNHKKNDPELGQSTAQSQPGEAGAQPRTRIELDLASNPLMRAYLWAEGKDVYSSMAIRKASLEKLPSDTLPLGGWILRNDTPFNPGNPVRNIIVRKKDLTRVLVTPGHKYVLEKGDSILWPDHQTHYVVDDMGITPKLNHLPHTIPSNIIGPEVHIHIPEGPEQAGLVSKATDMLMMAAEEGKINFACSLPSYWDGGKGIRFNLVSMGELKVLDPVLRKIEKLVRDASPYTGVTEITPGIPSLYRDYLPIGQYVGFVIRNHAGLNLAVDHDSLKSSLTELEAYLIGRRTLPNEDVKDFIGTLQTYLTQHPLGTLVIRQESPGSSISMSVSQMRLMDETASFFYQKNMLQAVAPKAMAVPKEEPAAQTTDNLSPLGKSQRQSIEDKIGQNETEVAELLKTYAGFDKTDKTQKPTDAQIQAAIKSIKSVSQSTPVVRQLNQMLEPALKLKPASMTQAQFVDKLAEELSGYSSLYIWGWKGSSEIRSEIDSLRRSIGSSVPYPEYKEVLEAAARVIPYDVTQMTAEQYQLLSNAGEGQKAAQMAEADMKLAMLFRQCLEANPGNLAPETIKSDTEILDVHIAELQKLLSQAKSGPSGA